MRADEQNTILFVYNLLVFSTLSTPLALAEGTARMCLLPTQHTRSPFLESQSCSSCYGLLVESGS